MVSYNLGDPWKNSNKTSTLIYHRRLHIRILRVRGSNLSLNDSKFTYQPVSPDRNMGDSVRAEAIKFCTYSMMGQASVPLSIDLLSFVSLTLDNHICLPFHGFKMLCLKAHTSKNSTVCVESMHIFSDQGPTMNYVSLRSFPMLRNPSFSQTHNYTKPVHEMSRLASACHTPGKSLPHGRQDQTRSIRPLVSISPDQQRQLKSCTDPPTDRSESQLNYCQLRHYRSKPRSPLSQPERARNGQLHRDIILESRDIGCHMVEAHLQEKSGFSQLAPATPRLYPAEHARRQHQSKVEIPENHQWIRTRQQLPPCRLHIVMPALLLCLIRLCGAAILGPPWPEPVFLPRLFNVTARHGDRALLPCAVHYLGTRQVTWRRLGSHHFISVGDLAWVKDPNLEMEFRELTPEVTEWNLVIKNVTPADEGTYECKISDKNELFRHVHLRVVGPPLVKKAKRPPVAISGKDYVETGHPIRLFCNVSGPDGLQLKIDWFKDGDSLQYPSPRNAIITNYNLVETNVLVSELFIDRSRASDSGIYICRSTMGIRSKTVTVLTADTSNVKRGESRRSENFHNKRRSGEIKVDESSSSRHRCLGLFVLLSWTVLAVMVSDYVVQSEFG